MNIRCSNRCANPVRPGDSSLDPTWYHRSTATSGLERSTCKMTGSPLPSVNVSNGIVSIGKGGMAVAAAYWHESNAARRLKHCVGALVVAFASIIATAGSARANGALPGSFGILLPATRPHDVVLATNFGIIISEDDGATWQWTC